MLEWLAALKDESGAEAIDDLIKRLKMVQNPFRKDVLSAGRKALYATAGKSSSTRESIKNWVNESTEANKERFNSHLLSETEFSPLKIEEIKPKYSDDSKKLMVGL